MTLKKNALYYYLRSKKISGAAIARENNISRQSFHQQLKIDFWKLRLEIFKGISKVTGSSISQVVDETLKVNRLAEKYGFLDEKDFIENLRSHIYD